MFGVLGYELLFREVSKFERERTLKLIDVYKKNREIFQYGEFEEVEVSSNNIKWQVSNKDKTKFIVFTFNALQSLIAKETALEVKGVDDEALYEVDVVGVNHDIREFGGLVNQITPFHVNPHGNLVALAANFIKMPAEIDSYVVKGSLLSGGAVKLTPEWSASGLSDKVRVLRDFGNRLYIITKKDETH